MCVLLPCIVRHKKRDTSSSFLCASFSYQLMIRLVYGSEYPSVVVSDTLSPTGVILLSFSFLSVKYSSSFSNMMKFLFNSFRHRPLYTISIFWLDSSCPTSTSLLGIYKRLQGIQNLRLVQPLTIQFKFSHNTNLLINITPNQFIQP